jgi:DNA-binding MarR family transcriptional regulator
MISQLSKSRREKVFGDGRPRALPTKIKRQVWDRARALTRPTEPRKHYGAITAKQLAVLGALLWGFHNVGSGLCFPSYEAIAEKAGCARSTVYEAIHALEAAGLLTWVHRLRRQDDRVVRTSNGYRFTLLPAAISSKSELRSGTGGQVSFPLVQPAPGEPDAAWMEQQREKWRTAAAQQALLFQNRRR